MFTDLVANVAKAFGLQDQQDQPFDFGAQSSLSNQILTPGNTGLQDYLLPELFGNQQQNDNFCPRPGRGYNEDIPLNAPSQYRGMIYEAAQQYGIDPLYLQELIRAESDFNPRSHSSAGAMGLTQMIPSTARAMGVTDPWDPRQSIFGGARYLAQMLRRYNGNYSLALSAYNAGPGRVDKIWRVPNIPETQNYVGKINRRVAALRAQQLVQNKWRLR